jgi:hypothetical protein
MADEDPGLSARGLQGIAWALGVFAGVSWLAAANLMDAPHPITRALGFWLAAAVISTVFSAACAVLCGVKEAAQRLAAPDRADQG